MATPSSRALQRKKEEKEIRVRDGFI